MFRFHRLAQAERTHIGPDLLDMFEALRFRARWAFRSPSIGDLSVDRPNGILLFVVDDNLIDGRVFFVSVHVSVSAFQAW